MYQVEGCIFYLKVLVKVFVSIIFLIVLYISDFKMRNVIIWH